APPLLIPANIPSSRARRLDMAIASDSLTSRTESTFLGSNILGRYSTGHFLIPGILELSVGCTPTICTLAFCSFKNVDVPIMVPVVPIEDTKWVLPPWVSLQISGPVVL